MGWVGRAAGERLERGKEGKVNGAGPLGVSGEISHPFLDLRGLRDTWGLGRPLSTSREASLSSVSGFGPGKRPTRHPPLGRDTIGCCGSRGGGPRLLQSPPSRGLGAWTSPGKVKAESVGGAGGGVQGCSLAGKLVRSPRRGRWMCRD